MAQPFQCPQRIPYIHRSDSGSTIFSKQASNQSINKKQKNKQTNERTNEQTNKQTNKQRNKEHMYRICSIIMLF